MTAIIPTTTINTTSLDSDLAESLFPSLVRLAQISPSSNNPVESAERNPMELDMGKEVRY